MITFPRLALVVPLMAAVSQGQMVERTYGLPAPLEGVKLGLHGAYLRLEAGSGEAAPGGELWFFTKEGRFSRTPRGGFDFKGFPTAATARGNEGLYGVKGDKLLLVMAGGKVRAEIAFARKAAEHVIGPMGSTPSAPRVTIERRESDELVIGGLAAVPVRGFKPDARLMCAYGGSGPSGGGTLRFYADGRFERHPPGGTGETAIVTGTYGLNEHTLTLKDSRGVEEKLTVAAVGEDDADGCPEFLWCEDRRLPRQFGGSLK